LTELPTPLKLKTSTEDLVAQFYVPALKRSLRYDRGVGYFTSSWLRLAATGLASLAENRGTCRLITSLNLQPDDWEAFRRGDAASRDTVLKGELSAAIDDLEHSLKWDTLTCLAWMLADGLLEIRIAEPTFELDGDFHDKIGLFEDSERNRIAFHGSQNESAKAFRNYESISLHYSWLGGRELDHVNETRKEFENLWEGYDVNVKMHKLPRAISEKIVKFVDHEPRPYKIPMAAFAPSNLWPHQQEAVKKFFAARHGILEMATGTGKTRTALEIMSELVKRDLVSSIIIVATGTDLLDQWHKQILERSDLTVFRTYERHDEALQYFNDPVDNILLRQL
jgi:hypothetical protein